MNSTVTMRKIDQINLDAIKVKLMHKQSGEGWSLARVNTMEIEYRRFLYMLHTYPAEQFAPLIDVDTFWHYHILDTRKYAADCEQTFGYFLHHNPNVALGDSEDDVAEHAAFGERMRELYQAAFGESCLSSSTAWCSLTDAPAQSFATAWCSVAAKAAGGTAWCSLTDGSRKPQATAWCSVTSPRARSQGTAWCSLTAGSDRVKARGTAWCSLTNGKDSAGKTAWCSVSASNDSARTQGTAWCSLRSAKGAAKALGTAWCSVTAAKQSKHKTAWCSLAAANDPVRAQQTAWCSLTDVKNGASNTAWCSVASKVVFTDTAAVLSA